tara:strand:- start:232 stop:1431 length:1200 start_codon:yes stop_codon:yes gene_type:complete
LIIKTDEYCLYITYDGLLDPLGSSQVLPYIESLSDQGYKFILFSFEKTDRSQKSIIELYKRLESRGIKWFYLPFKKRRFGYFIRIFKIWLLIKSKIKNIKVLLFHTRGITTAILYFFCGLRCPLIYDIRAFAGEYIDCGRLSKKSIFSLFLMFFEKYLINLSSGIVVLDQSGADYIREKYSRIKGILKVIPTCTNTKLFSKKNKLTNSSRKNYYRLVFLGGARYPYRADLAIILVKKLLKNNILCKIDFINERDHDYISDLCRKIGIPKKSYNIFSLPQREIASHLINYDAGIIFNTTGFWRRMSSPTKLGEYLASGLNIISLSGINLIDTLSIKEPEIFEIFNENDFKNKISKARLLQIENKLKDPYNSDKARKLAFEKFDLAIGNKQYKDLYDSLLV